MASTRNPAADRIARLKAGVVNLPTIGFGSPLVIGLGAAEAAAQAFNLTLAQTAAIGGVAGAVIGAMALAISAARANAQRAAESLREVDQALLSVIQRAHDMRSVDLRAQLDNALDQLNFAQAFADLMNDQLAKATLNVVPIAALLGTDANYETAKTAAADANQALRDAENQVTALTQALGLSSVATNDATEALRKLTQLQIDLAEREFEITQMTAEERAKSIAVAQQEIAFLQQRIYNEEMTTDAAEQLSIRIGDLGKEIESIAEVTDTYVDQLEREKAAKQLVTDSYDEYFEALDLEAAARTELIEISRQLAILEEETAERRAQALEDRNVRISDIEEDAADRRAKIIADGLERINKIQRDAGRKQLSAIGLRDALALYEAQLHAQDQLQDQKEAQEKQLRSVNEALDKQRRMVERQYERQLETINRSYEKQQQRLAYAYQVQEVALQNAINAQQAIALNGVNGQTVIHTQLWTQVNSIAVQWAFNTVNTLRNIFGLNGGGGGVLPGNAIPPGGVPNFLSSSAFNMAVDRRINLTLRSAY